jgi:hypothetical protein
LGWKTVALDRLPLHVGDSTVADRLHFVASAKGVRIPITMDFIVFAVGRCNELFMYVYIDNGTPIQKQLLPFERPLADSMVQHSTRAGCLRPGPA